MMKSLLWTAKLLQDPALPASFFAHYCYQPIGRLGETQNTRRRAGLLVLMICAHALSVTTTFVDGWMLTSTTITINVLFQSSLPGLLGSRLPRNLCRAVISLPGSNANRLR
ncbi:uncharacterized protein EI97DRAFT_109126 [Westerdykella ornata]|uniref:Uncharacterized protein n=1 Tax=Westerdykella ornata TaxID=318751 RepID=A0A6A6JYE7_WESOR|nr:uncharacterized protein EI97DRAFT_109126 [Westerdykella ornata]KAF2280059.1 hypothetical protein EI97DRAFT_109126 [Westerdykella ornata]